jgi:hypothetical protein
MIRYQSDDFKSLYYITSADWEVVIEASSFNAAASRGLEKVYEDQGIMLKLSPAIIVIELTGFSNNFNDEYTKIFSTSLVLSDIGLHDLAKKFKKIIQP